MSGVQTTKWEAEYYSHLNDRLLQRDLENISELMSKWKDYLSKNPLSTWRCIEEWEIKRNIVIKELEKEIEWQEQN